MEEKNGLIEFRVVNNDNSRESTIILTGLKAIFQKQLPKMPADYIARLVYDRSHLSMAIVKKPLEVVGGITYRPFPGRQFAEIVFCAISSDQQVRGYGAHLMSHLKVHLLRKPVLVLTRRILGLCESNVRCYVLSHLRRQLCHRIFQETGLHKRDYTG